MSGAIAGIGGYSPQIVSGASAWASPTTKMGQLFQSIDASNSGSITNGQFQQAFSNLNPPANFQALGADQIFSQLDPQGTGSVSKADFVSGMTSLMRTLNSGNASSSGSSASQSLSQSLQSLLQLGQRQSPSPDGVGQSLDASV